MHKILCKRSYLWKKSRAWFWAFAPFLLPAFGKASSQGWNPAEEIWFLKSHFDLFHFKESSFHARAPVWWPQTCTSGLWVWTGPLVASFHPVSRAQEMALGPPGKACERAGFIPWDPGLRHQQVPCLFVFLVLPYLNFNIQSLSTALSASYQNLLWARECVCVCVRVCTLLLLNHSQLFATPRTETHQIPLSMEFSRQEYWSGLPFPIPGDLPNLGINQLYLSKKALL